MMEPSNKDILNKDSYKDQTLFLTLNESIHVYNLSVLIFCFQGVIFWIAIYYTFPYSFYIFIPSILIIFSSLYGFFTKSKSALYPLLCYYLFISTCAPILSITVTIASIFESTTGVFSQKNITIYEAFNYSDNLFNLIPLNILLFLISIIYLYKFNILHRCIGYCDIATIINFDQTHDLKPSNYSGSSDIEKIPILTNEDIEDISIKMKNKNNFTIVEECSSDEDFFEDRRRA